MTEWGQRFREHQHREMAPELFFEELMQSLSSSPKSAVLLYELPRELSLASLLPKRRTFESADTGTSGSS